MVFRRNGKRLSTFLWTRRGTVLSRVVAKSGNFEGPHCGEHDVREPLMQSSVWDLRWHYLPFKVLIENGKKQRGIGHVGFCLWLLWPSQVTPKLTWGPRRSWTWESLRLKIPEILDVLLKIQTCSMGVRSLDFALSAFRKAGHPLRVLSLLASIIVFSIKVQICTGWKCLHNHHSHENNPNVIMYIQIYFYAHIFPICGFWPVVFWIEIRRVRMWLIGFFLALIFGGCRIHQQIHQQNSGKPKNTEPTWATKQPRTVAGRTGDRKGVLLFTLGNHQEHESNPTCIYIYILYI